VYCNATAITDKVQRYSNNQVNGKLGIIFLASRFTKKIVSKLRLVFKENCLNLVINPLNPPFNTGKSISTQIIIFNSCSSFLLGMADFKVFHQISLSLGTYNIFRKVDEQKYLSIFKDFLIKAYREKLVQPTQGFEGTITLYLQDV
jgi:hypothetical protein